LTKSPLPRVSRSDAVSPRRSGVAEGENRTHQEQREDRVSHICFCFFVSVSSEVSPRMGRDPPSSSMSKSPSSTKKGAVVPISAKVLFFCFLKLCVCVLCFVLVWTDILC